MKVKAQMEMMFENELHIEKILHLPSLISRSHNLMRNLPDEFEDVLDSIRESRHESMNNLWSFFEPCKSVICNVDGVEYEEDEDDDYEPDEAEELMNLQEMDQCWPEVEQSQFLVLFNKAKRFYSSKNSWRSGGIYYTQWIAAPTINKALQEGKKWAKQMDKHDLASMNKE
jgi:hypothetical protein